MQTSVPLSVRSRPAPWYRHPWPWLLMLGPFIVVLAGIHTTWLAFSRQDALVVGDYYKQGKAINQDLRRDRVAAGLEIDFSLAFEPANGLLVGSVRSYGRPLQGGLALSLNHSTLPQKDIRLQVHPDANGRFEAAIPMLDMAHWHVMLEDSERDWRLAGRWMWPQQKTITVTAETPVLPD
jgi:uncharacterized protein